MNDLAIRLLDAAIERAPTKDSATIRDCFRALLETAERIRRQRAPFDAALEQAARAYEAARGEHESALRRLQETCPHPVSTHHRDPSGGSDSFHCCEICGKEW